MTDTTPSPATAGGVLQVLRSFAEGRIQHLYRGTCPDAVEGPDSRDPECEVCQALAAFGSAAPAGDGETWTEDRLRAEAKLRGWHVREGASVPTEDGYKHPFTVTIPSCDLLALLPATPAGVGGELPGYGIIDPDYARVFTIARCIAWAEGYALAMHGSFTRDLDLIAVPWTDAACEPEHLARRIEDAAGLRITTPGQDGEKPHGRLVWTLRFKTFGDPRFIDLSIMPRRLASTGSADADEETALASYKRMFRAACDSLGRIAHELGINPDEGGHGPILAAIAELRASTGSAPAPSAWQPIETAPKDGRRVLLAKEGSGGPAFCGFFRQASQCWTDENCGAREPTHWQPLPAAPTQEQQG